MTPELASYLLSGYKVIESEINSLAEANNALNAKKRAMRSIPSPSIGGIHAQNPVDKSSVLIGLISDEYDNNKRIKELTKILEGYRKFIDEIPGMASEYLFAYYVLSKSWNEIGRLFNVSPDSARYEANKSLREALTVKDLHFN